MHIDSDLKAALLEKDEVKISALRNLKAEIKNVEIEKQHALSDEEVLDVVRRKVKQHRDSIDSFMKGGRADLVDREQAQMAVLAKYLPQQLSEDEVKKLVSEVIAELRAAPSDFGKVMKEVLAKAGGRTDGSVVSKIVKEKLK
ncbi:MAG: hypothetical protein A3H72_02195 [Candidatus Doudnabacteria bacterium RIFCSPLOWO2_02_FULL_48_8]|uniref:Glutamyl-tRNA amidotransferase n=1 Tax=Candidatus Doudnabacteria bacterium RIFCSPHIGHO2_01_FULL_46_24 TaxID=1817825 RepID=A0A1F5NT35_9BACT|nr:MAG: hypothetical protein A2720_04015 [Candidatus Doudnabacteria bacterium RIFCSPHIGHO2_01_FULL_46_24]OGE94010.1 MAG: hypothetical protein A3E98_04465 [Candidatus Doudnabacteria bacterium RIFCSPHIGHO2_12_FULL_48_11]OGE95217.1 MAG: hypothetical protein A3H72_02195 [Candidatus Doudnabacteria bacterium RIFCSPLOWO2_02_FULL_48_8]